jgi:hypothetical protein
MFVAWGLAEIFTRKRRMALPSIFLSFAFVCSIAGSAAILIGGTGRYTYASLYISLLPVGAIICAILAACFHYWRFRVAIDVTIAVAGLASLTLLILHRVAPETGAMLERWLAFALGLAIFAFAMRFDLADPRRVTHRGDIAFWLHLLAAQLIVHGLFRGFEGVASFFSKDATAAHAPVIIAVTLAFILVALLIDRRALIVSALSYAGVALWALVSGHGIPKGEAVSLTLLMLGAMILALSIGWRPLRRLIVPRLPLRGLVSRLPPVEKSS